MSAAIGRAVEVLPPKQDEQSPSDAPQRIVIQRSADGSILIEGTAEENQSFRATLNLNFAGGANNELANKLIASLLNQGVKVENVTMVPKRQSVKRHWMASELLTLVESVLKHMDRHGTIQAAEMASQQIDGRSAGACYAKWQEINRNYHVETYVQALRREVAALSVS